METSCVCMSAPSCGRTRSHFGSRTRADLSSPCLVPVLSMLPLLMILVGLWGAAGAPTATQTKQWLQDHPEEKGQLWIQHWCDSSGFNKAIKKKVTAWLIANADTQPPSPIAVPSAPSDSQIADDIADTETGQDGDRYEDAQDRWGSPMGCTLSYATSTGQTTSQMSQATLSANSQTRQRTLGEVGVHPARSLAEALSISTTLADELLSTSDTQPTGMPRQSGAPVPPWHLQSSAPVSKPPELAASSEGAPCLGAAPTSTTAHGSPLAQIGQTFGMGPPVSSATAQAQAMVQGMPGSMGVQTHGVPVNGVGMQGYGVAHGPNAWPK